MKKWIWCLLLLSIGGCSMLDVYSRHNHQEQQKFWQSVANDNVLSREAMKLEFNAQRMMFSVGTQDGKVHIRSLSNGDDVLTIKAHKRRVSNLASSKDGLLLASSSTTIEPNTKIWDTQTGKLVHDIPNTKGPEIFSVDTPLMFLADSSRIHLFNPTDGSFYSTIYESSGGINSLALSSDEGYLAVGNMGKVQIWKVNKSYSGFWFWKQLTNVTLELAFEKTLYAPKDWIRQVRFSSDSKRLIVLTRFGFIHLMNVDGLTSLASHWIPTSSHIRPSFIEGENAILVKSWRRVSGVQNRRAVSYLKILPESEDVNAVGAFNCQSVLPLFIKRSNQEALGVTLEEMVIIDTEQVKIDQLSNDASEKTCLFSEMDK